MRKNKDYYRVLGVQPRSHARTIEETYWERAHRLHEQPTRKAQQQLVALNEAYETLASPYKREAYDRKRERALEDEEQARRNSGLAQRLLQVLSKPFRPD